MKDVLKHPVGSSLLEHYASKRTCKLSNWSTDLTDCWRARNLSSGVRAAIITGLRRKNSVRRASVLTMAFRYFFFFFCTKEKTFLTIFTRLGHFFAYYVTFRAKKGMSLWLTQSLRHKFAPLPIRLNSSAYWPRPRSYRSNDSSVTDGSTVSRFATKSAKVINSGRCRFNTPISSI